ncbi:hypothetical protein GCM10022207_86440 [Streptomyces lannensis]|uniref:ATP-binding protein n=2 Tax=Streptomyces TaxID=1883 RepID=A0ABP7LQ91_9ACTN
MGPDRGGAESGRRLLRPPGVNTGTVRGAYWGAMTKPAAPKRHLPTSPFKAPVVPAPKHFVVGDQVTHDVYGLGRVIGIEDGSAVLVDFGSEQVRIVSPYAKMTKL